MLYTAAAVTTLIFIFNVYNCTQLSPFSFYLFSFKICNQRMESTERSKLFANWTTQLVASTQLKGQCHLLSSQTNKNDHNSTNHEQTAQLQTIVSKFQSLYNHTCESIINALEPLNLQTIKILSTNSTMTDSIRSQIQTIYLKIDELCFDIERLKHNCNLNINTIDQLLATSEANGIIDIAHQLDLDINIKSMIKLTNCESRAAYIRDKCSSILNENSIKTNPQTLENLTTSFADTPTNNDENINYSIRVQTLTPSSSPDTYAQSPAIPIPQIVNSRDRDHTQNSNRLNASKSGFLTRSFLSPTTNALKHKVYKSHTYKHSAISNSHKRIILSQQQTCNNNTMSRARTTPSSPRRGANINDKPDCSVIGRSIVKARYSSDNNNNTRDSKSINTRYSGRYADGVSDSCCELDIDRDDNDNDNDNDEDYDRFETSTQTELELTEIDHSHIKQNNCNTNLNRNRIGLEQVSMYEDFEKNVVKLRKRTPKEIEKNTSFYDFPDDAEPGSFIAAVISMTKGLIGVAILALPFAFQRGSIVIASMVLLLCCSCSCFTFILLAEMCSYTGHYSLMHLWKSAFGYSDVGGRAARWGAVFVEFVNFFNPFTCLIGFMNVINKAFDAQWMKTHNSSTSKQSLVIFVLLSTTFPLCMMKNINSKPMALAGLFGTFSAVFLPIALINHQNFEDIVEYGPANLNWFSLDNMWDIAMVFGLVNVACSAHHNAPRYFEEFSRNRSQKEAISLFRIAALIAFGVALLFYFSTAVFAYIVLSFNRDDENAPVPVQDNIIGHFHSLRFCAIVVNIWFLINALVTIPHHFHAARRSYYNLIREFGFIPKSLTNDKLYNTINWWAVSCFMFIIVYIGGAVIFKNLAIISAWRGATTNILLIYVLPTVIFLRLKSKTFESNVANYNVFQERKAYMLSKALKKKLITLPQYHQNNTNNNNSCNQTTKDEEQNITVMKLKRESRDQHRTDLAQCEVESQSDINIDDDMSNQCQHRSDYYSDMQMVHPRIENVSMDVPNKQGVYTSIHSILMNEGITPMASSPDITVNMEVTNVSKDKDNVESGETHYRDQQSQISPVQPNQIIQNEKKKIVIRKIKKPKFQRSKTVIILVLCMGVVSGICGMAGAIRATFF